MVVQLAWPSFCSGSVLFSSLDHIWHAAESRSVVAADVVETRKIVAIVVESHMMLLLKAEKTEIK